MSNQALKDPLQPFLDRIYRRSKSEKSRANYSNATTIFCRWYGKEPLQVIKDLKEARADVYKALDDFVTYLSESNKAPNTIKNYFAAVKKFLRFYGIEFSNFLHRNWERLEMFC